MVLQSYQLPLEAASQTSWKHKKEGNVGLLQGEERSPKEGSIFPTAQIHYLSVKACTVPPPAGSLPGIPSQPTDPASLPVETFVYFHLPGTTVTSTERLASLRAEVPKSRLENVSRNLLDWKQTRTTWFYKDLR